MPAGNKQDPLWDRLSQCGGSSLDYWKPEPGDALIGVILDMDIRQTKHSGNTPVLTVHDEITDRAIEVWALHTVLRSELKDRRPSVGDRIAIKRLADSDRGYRRFFVGTDSPANDVDWDSVAASGSDMAAQDLTDETAKLTGVTPVGDGLPY